MGTSNTVEQHSNVLFPENGQTLAITLDNTARSYDLTSLDLGGGVPEGDLDRRLEVFLCVQSDGADAFLSFSKTAKTINETTTVAAGGTLAFADGMAAKVVNNLAPIRFRIDRSRAKFLNVKGSAAGTLRLWVASHASI